MKQSVRRTVALLAAVLLCLCMVPAALAEGSEETAPQEEPAEEKKEGIPWGVTAFVLALITTFLQNKFIHGRKR